MRNRIHAFFMLVVFMAVVQQLTAQWSVLGTKAFSSGKAYAQVILKKSPAGVLYVAFHDSTAGGSCAIQVMKFTAGQWTQVGSIPFGNTTPGRIAFTIDNSETPWIFYSAPVDGKGVVRKFTGNRWVFVGDSIFGISESNAHWPCIAVMNTGTPIVAYADFNNNLKATVKYFNGTDWVLLGNTVASSTFISTWLSLVVDQNDQPFLALKEGSPSNVVRVKTLSNNNWIYAGSQTFSTSNPSYYSLHLSSNNKIFLCYGDQTGGSDPKIYRFDNPGWTRIGDYFDGANMCFYPSLATDANEVPHIVVQDNNTFDHRASVFFFDGVNWIPAGDTGISDRWVGWNGDFAASSLTIAIDNTGTPVIAYADNANGRKVTAMRYQGCVGCVWPGDADNNGVVDNFDLLPISVGYGKQGAARPTASIQWQAQAAPNWNASYQNLVNYKFSDTNGNGIIDNTDVDAINQNWSLTHNKTDGNEASRNAPFIYCKILNDTIYPSDTITIEVWTGDSLKTIPDAYVFAADIQLDPAVVSPSSLQVSFEENWLDTLSKLVTLSKVDSSSAKVYLGIGKTTSFPSSGFGKIATITAVAVDSIHITSHTDGLAIITKNRQADNMGNTIILNPKSDSVFIIGNPVLSVNKNLTDNKVLIVPNPASGSIHISGIAQGTPIIIANLLGEVVYSAKAKSETEIIPINNLPSGMYFLNKQKFIKE